VEHLGYCLLLRLIVKIHLGFLEEVIGIQLAFPGRKERG
jgi:hypothetical protein